jgi:hypothetical protein
MMKIYIELESPKREKQANDEFFAKNELVKRSRFQLCKSMLTQFRLE